MVDVTAEPTFTVEPPDISHIITEDDTPVDNLFSAKQHRLLVHLLYSAWRPGRPFLADTDVGVFSAVHQPPVVPDMFLSLDVEAPREDWWAKEHRSYFLWEYGKPPDVVVEVVSNTKGRGLGEKMQAYARIGVRYYAVYDPQQLIQDESLQVFELHAGEYVARQDYRLENVGLELVVWEGVYEEAQGPWLRWCDSEGRLLPTGAELAQQERQRAEQERQRAERLAARLRELGVDPEDV